MLGEMDAQVFVTCIERKDVEAVWPEGDSDDHGMFHVEHGKIAKEPA
jgi:DNA replication and repair protein RecF